jgi:hypothetical protein
MSDSEKWARWTLGVVALTIAAYGAFLVFFGHGPAISSVFALLALTSIPASSRRYFRGRRLDEREREIANKALLASFSAFWLAFCGLIMTIYFIKGWDATLTMPVWVLLETLMWSTSLVLAVQAVTTIKLYR